MDRNTWAYVLPCRGDPDAGEETNGWIIIFRNKRQVLAPRPETDMERLEAPPSEGRGRGRGPTMMENRWSGSGLRLNSNLILLGFSFSSTLAAQHFTGAFGDVLYI